MRKSFAVGLAGMLDKLRRYRPREAAVAIVNYVNHRNPNVSMLALNVGAKSLVVKYGRTDGLL